MRATKKILSFLLLGALAAVAACSSDSTSDNEGNTGSTADAGGMAMKAPTLQSVMKMDGGMGLMLMWTNAEKACDSNEIERKMMGEDFKVVLTAGGTDQSKMDMTATMDMSYTYRLRCKMGKDYSPYSNEVSANPMK